jgi:hypothetical protein
MSLEQNNEQHYRECPDKYHDPAEDYEMSTRDYVLRPSADQESGAITVVLPPVAEAKGRFYSILAREADVVNSVTITHRDDSEYWVSDIVLTICGDRALLYSDGLCWHPLSVIAGIHPY